VNNTAEETHSVNISVQEKPEWISFNNYEINSVNITNTRAQTIQFYFNVSDNALPGAEGSVTFIITAGNNKEWTRVYKVNVISPRNFEIQQNYPNPFNPATKIKYSVPADGLVNISVFNVLGEKVTDLVNSVHKAGSYEVTFDATNFATGMYIYRMESGNFVSVKKMMILK